MFFDSLSSKAEDLETEEFLLCTAEEREKYLIPNGNQVATLSAMHQMPIQLPKEYEFIHWQEIQQRSKPKFTNWMCKSMVRILLLSPFLFYISELYIFFKS